MSEQNKTILVPGEGTEPGAKTEQLTEQAQAQGGEAITTDASAATGADPGPDRAEVRLKIMSDPELPPEDYEQAKRDPDFMEKLVDAYIEQEKETAADGTKKEEGALPKSADDAQKTAEGDRGRLSGYRRKQIKIDRLTRENYELKQKLEQHGQQIQQLLDRADGKKPAAADGNERDALPPKPKPEEYAKAGKSYEEYTEDLASWKAAQIVEERLTRERENYQRSLAANRQEQDKRDREAFMADRNERWAEQVLAARDAHEDFDDAVFEAGFPKTEVMINTIMDSEVGAEIAYYLANHLDVAQAIADMPPISAIRVIGRLEAPLIDANKKAANKPNGTAGVKVGAGQNGKVKNLPPPIQPVRGGSAKTVKDYQYYGDPEKSSAQEYEEARRNNKLV